MSRQCECVSFGCGGIGGRKLKTAEWKRHVKNDFQATLNSVATSMTSFSPINEWDRQFDPSIFTEHWSAKTPFNSKLSVLEFLFEIMKDFVSSPKASKESVSNHLYKEKYKFAEHLNDKLPETYNQAVNILEPFLMPLHRYHACPNDCVLFRGEHKDRIKCPDCGSPRYEEDGKTAMRNFSYFPLTPRIRRIVQTKGICNLLTKHEVETQEPDIQTDIQHSKIWKEDWFGENGLFKDTDLGLSMSACLDGVNPFQHLHVKHSMWPIEISLNNLPPSIRKTSAGILIAGIIPSAAKGREPNIDTYLRLLVEEFKTLENCKMTNYQGNEITVSVKLLNYVLDFPAIGKVLHLPGSARSYRACPFCRINGVDCSCNKTLFLDNRRFLPQDHPLRLQSVGHVGNSSEIRDPPPPPPSAEEISRLRRRYDQLPNKNQKENFTKEHGLKGTYPFMDLSYHQFQADTGPDIMHTLKDVGVNFSRIVNGFFSIEKQHEVEVEKRKQETNMMEGIFTPDEIAAIDDNMERIIYPTTATGCKKSFITQASHVNPSHAWHEYFTKNVVLFAIRGWKNVKMRRSITFWLSVMNRVVRYVVDTRELPSLKNDIALAASLMERDFPLIFNVITTHLLLHEADTSAIYGPVHSRWMFFFERLNSYITRRVVSRKHPEASAIRTIRMADFVNDAILGGRFKNAKDDPSTRLEELLVAAITDSHESPMLKSGRKRQRQRTITVNQRQMLERILGRSVHSINVLNKYQSKESQDTGTIEYDAGKRNTFQKSSRFVYVSSENYGMVIW